MRRPRWPTSTRPSPKKLAVRKVGGNVVELGSILAFGFSPLWLLAGAADVTRGTRVYLDALVGELKAAGVLARESEFASVDDLLAALEGASGTTARLIDIPPLEVEGLKRSLADLRHDAKSLPTPPELAAVYQGLLAEADREQRSLLEVSVGMGLAFFNSARKVGRQHVLDPYTEDLRPLRDEGFAAYARRVGSPYASAVARHFDPAEATLTERGLGRLSRPKLLESESMAHPDSFGARSTLDGRRHAPRDLPARRAPGQLRRRAAPLHAAHPARERAPDGGRRHRHGADVEAVAGWVATRRAVAGDLASRPRASCCRTSPACPPSSTSPRCATRCTTSAATRAKINPLHPGRARDRPLGAGRRVRDAARDLRATPSSSSSATASATPSCAGARAPSTNFKVVPPSTGIVHQVNLEFLARVVEERDGVAFPDTLVGTDSHTTMINGLGVLGWGVGGIEAEAAMLGEALSMLVPQVVGFRLTGALPEGATATDLVLTVTQILRETGVVGKFVEYFGHGLAALPLADRATIGNMSPEYGATCGFFPVDDETLRYLRLTGRRDEQHRARRGVLQGERALARPGRAADVLAGRRARPRRRSSRRSPGRGARRTASRCATRRRRSSTRCRASASTTGTGTTRRSPRRFPASDPLASRRAGPRAEPADASVSTAPRVALAERTAASRWRCDGETFELEPRLAS